MMLAIALCLLVALATSDVNAQATYEYDIADCRVYTMAGHHAENPDDCRTFYNCDNKNGGVLTKCSDGTTYNSRLGLCTRGSNCTKWFDLANCRNQQQQQGSRKFAGFCCRTYYDYSCVTGSYQAGNCGEGQYFDEARQTCVMGTPPSSQCDPCNVMDLPADFCKMTHLTRVTNCSFKKLGSDQVESCPLGTAFDSRLCLCTLDVDNRCPVNTPNNGCNAKQRFNVARGLFEENPTTQEAPYQFQGGRGISLWRLQGQDLMYTSFAIRLSVNLQQQQGGEVGILNAEPSCTGLKLNVKIQNTQLIVSLGVGNQAMTLQGNINPNGQAVIVVFIDAKTKRFMATANNAPLQNLNANSPMFDSWSGQIACKMDVGPFPGTVNEVAYWRECDITRIPNN